MTRNLHISYGLWRSRTGRVNALFTLNSAEHSCQNGLTETDWIIEKIEEWLPWARIFVSCRLVWRPMFRTLARQRVIATHSTRHIHTRTNNVTRRQTGSMHECLIWMCSCPQLLGILADEGGWSIIRRMVWRTAVGWTIVPLTYRYSNIECRDATLMQLRCSLNSHDLYSIILCTHIDHNWMLFQLDLHIFSEESFLEHPYDMHKHLHFWCCIQLQLYGLIRYVCSFQVVSNTLPSWPITFNYLQFWVIFGIWNRVPDTMLYVYLIHTYSTDRTRPTSVISGGTHIWWGIHVTLSTTTQRTFANSHQPSSATLQLWQLCGQNQL